MHFPSRTRFSFNRKPPSLTESGNVSATWICSFLSKDIVMSVPLFSDADPEFISMLLPHLKPLYVAPNETIIRMKLIPHFN